LSINTAEKTKMLSCLPPLSERSGHLLSNTVWAFEDSSLRTVWIADAHCGGKVDY